MSMKFSIRGLLIITAIVAAFTMIGIWVTHSWIRVALALYLLAYIVPTLVVLMYVRRNRIRASTRQRAVVDMRELEELAIQAIRE